MNASYGDVYFESVTTRPDWRCAAAGGAVEKQANVNAKTRTPNLPTDG
jgi:hypothetical protein